MFYGNLPKFGNKVKIGNKAQFTNWCNVWSIEGVAVYGHVQEYRVTFGRGRLHNVWEITISTIKLPEGRFQTFPDKSLSEELIWKSHRPYNKTAAFRGIILSPAKQLCLTTKKVWLPDRHTDGLTNRQTPVKVIPMCRYASQATQ